MRRQRNTNKRSMFFIAFVLILMLGIGVVQITASYNKNLEKEAELAALQADYDAEVIRKIELNLMISEMDSRAFKERMARQKFGLIYPDEILIDTGRE